MIEMRWKQQDRAWNLDSKALHINGWHILQYRETGTYTTVTGDGVTEGLTTLEYEWKDVEIEE